MYREKYFIFIKTNARLSDSFHARIWVPRDQTRPGSFSREGKESGIEVALYLRKYLVQLHGDPDERGPFGELLQMWRPHIRARGPDSAQDVPYSRVHVTTVRYFYGLAL